MVINYLELNMKRLLNYILLRFLPLMDNGTRVKIMLFRIGNAVVYYREANQYIPYKMGDWNLYWCDPVEPNGYGPFNTLDTLMKHYEYTLVERLAKKAAIESSMAGNVIRVDFKNKIRNKLIPIK